MQGPCQQITRVGSKGWEYPLPHGPKHCHYQVQVRLQARVVSQQHPNQSQCGLRRCPKCPVPRMKCQQSEGTHGPHACMAPLHANPKLVLGFAPTQIALVVAGRKVQGVLRGSGSKIPRKRNHKQNAGGQAPGHEGPVLPRIALE